MPNARWLREFAVRKRSIFVAVILIIGTRTLVAQDTAPAPQQIPPDVVQPLILKRVAPIYPPLARQARIQGTVLLDITINKGGDVSDVTLVSGHPMLSPAAVDAVKQWKYRPYEEHGQAVEIQTTVQINFGFSDNPPSGVVGDGPPSSSPMQTIVDPVGVCEDKGDNSLSKRIRVSPGVMGELLISKRPPIYPEEARTANIQGTVLIAMEIGRDGNVCNVALISGHPLLAPIAIEAVKQWKYHPYLLNGQPIEVQTQARVNFTLKPE